MALGIAGAPRRADSASQKRCASAAVISIGTAVNFFGE